MSSSVKRPFNSNNKNKSPKIKKQRNTNLSVQSLSSNKKNHNISEKFQINCNQSQDKKEKGKEKGKDKGKDKENNKNNVKNEKDNNQNERSVKKNFIRIKSEIYETKKSKSINKKIDESKSGKNDEGNISLQKKPKELGKKGLGCKSTKNITTSFPEFKEDLVVKKSEKMLNRIAMFESKGNKEKDGIIYKGKMPNIGSYSNKKVCQSNTESNNK